MTNTKHQRPENGFLNIIFNIILPVLILNRGTKFIGPLWALLLALSFPLGYGAYDLIKRRKTNVFSILGLLNVSVTGSLALLGLHGIWFSVKEAAFPSLVGLFVFGSAFTKKPFIEVLFMNPAVMNVDRLHQKLRENKKESEFHQHMKKATMFLCLSFGFSAICNFILAERIFLPIDPALAASEQSIILNSQIATMTSWSMAVIMVPSILFLLGVFWYLLKGIKEFSGLTTDDIIVQK